jgi:hypothetical protein
MATECSKYRALIPAGMLGDLGSEEQDALRRHLSECAPCRGEQELYSGTFTLLRAEKDVPVPKHFFVHEEESRTKPWQLVRSMPFAWQGVLAAVAVVVLVASAAALSRLQVRAEAGALMIGFGSLPALQTTPPVDPAELEARVLRAVSERSRAESAEWTRTLRAEIATSERTLTRRQRDFVDRALAGLEARMAHSVTAAMTSLEHRTDRTVSGLYQAVSTQREADLAAIENRFNRIAVNGEIKSSETDAILEALLEVAELRTR